MSLNKLAEHAGARKITNKERAERVGDKVMHGSKFGHDPRVEAEDC
jgi:hypothetical protein